MSFARVVDIQGQRPGKTLLITGGMDGDEYAGIEAAKKLSKEFSAGNFCGRLIIIPIVNVPGHEAGVSQNPLDQKIPKFIFPGKSHGSPTERLINWLNVNYITKANVWHDMHGGASDEELNPFLWTYQTGVKNIDAISEKLHQIVPTKIVLHEKAGWFSKARALARKGTGYIVAESGDLGRVREEDVERHVTWAKCIMFVLGMIDQSPRTHVIEPPEILHKILFLNARSSGLWNLNSEKITGTPLWWKKAGNVKRGEFVAAIGMR